MTVWNPSPADPFAGLPDDAVALRRALTGVEHLLGPLEPPAAWRDTLISRLSAEPDPAVAAAARRLGQARPGLINAWPTLPDHEPALRRVVTLPFSFQDRAAIPGGLLLTDPGTGLWLLDPASWAARLVLAGGAPMCSLEVAPDGRWVAVGREDDSLDLVDVAGWTVRATVPAAGGEADIAPDGTYLVCGRSGWDAVLIVDAATGLVRARLDDLPDLFRLRQVRFAPAGDWFALVTASRDGDVSLTVHDPGTGRVRIRDGWPGHVGRIRAISPDGRTLVVERPDGTVGYDVRTGARRATTEPPEPGPGPVPCLRNSVGDLLPAVDAAGRPYPGDLLTPEGLLVTGPTDGSPTVRVYELAALPVMDPATHDYDGVGGLAVSPSGSWLASGGHAGSVRLYDTGTGAVRTLRRRDQQAGQVAVVAGPDPALLLTVTGNRTVTSWHLPTGAGTDLLTVDGPVTSCTVQPDRMRAVTTGTAGLRVWDLTTGRCTHELAGRFTGCTAPSTVDWLLLHRSDGGGWIWHPETGAVPVRLAGTTGRNVSWTVSPTGDRIVRLADNGTTLYDAASGGIRLIRRGSAISCAAAPDGSWFVTSGVGLRPLTWDAATGTRIHTLVGHTSTVDGHEGVADVAVSPDGRWIASAGWERVLRIWNAATGRCVTGVRVVDDIRTVAWLPGSDGVAASAGRGVHLFRFSG